MVTLVIYDPLTMSRILSTTKLANNNEPGFSSKIMQKHSKLGSLEDQDPKSKISKINFASWIRGFCRHSSHPFFLKDQDPRTESRFSPKIMQIRCKPAGGG